MDIIKATKSKAAFKGYFKDYKTWAAWETYLGALFGIPEAVDKDILKACTGLDSVRPEGYNTSFVAVSRRGGKTTCAALITAYIAIFGDYHKRLSPGEKAHIYLISVNRDQARILKNRILGFLNISPDISSLIDRQTQDSIDIGDYTITVKPASFRGVRGATLAACILEELSFFRYEESAIPDKEIYRAVRPALMKGGLLMGISSPFQKAGLLYEKHKLYWGRDSGTLIWQADSKTMNPTLDDEMITEAYEEDPESAATEYGGKFRADLSSYISVDAVEACIIPGRLELAAQGEKTYYGGIDSSGSRSDSFTACISHKEEERVIIDVLREVEPPFNPSQVCKEFSAIFKDYGINEIQGDRYAGDWVVEAFRDNDIKLEHTEKNKSQLYLELLGPLNSGTIELLDNKRLKHQLISLDRKARAGRDFIDNFHGHDDLSNVLALAAAMAYGEKDSGVFAEMVGEVVYGDDDLIGPGTYEIDD